MVGAWLGHGWGMVGAWLGHKARAHFAPCTGRIPPPRVAVVEEKEAKSTARCPENNLIFAQQLVLCNPCLTCASKLDPFEASTVLLPGNAHSPESSRPTSMSRARHALRTAANAGVRHALSASMAPPGTGVGRCGRSWQPRWNTMNAEERLG
eukprot:356872-Chlamydomonas_euryale.AAC.4